MPKIPEMDDLSSNLLNPEKLLSNFLPVKVILSDVSSGAALQLDLDLSPPCGTEK